MGILRTAAAPGVSRPAAAGRQYRLLGRQPVTRGLLFSAAGGDPTSARSGFGDWFPIMADRQCRAKLGDGLPAARSAALRRASVRARRAALLALSRSASFGP